MASTMACFSSFNRCVSASVMHEVGMQLQYVQLQDK
jgi:hypothetical protein